MRAISKFAMLLVAVATMMGMTSCNPSESESKTYSGTVIARYYRDKGVFIDEDGAWLKSKSPFGTVSLYDGIYRFNLTYNPAETEGNINMVDITSEFECFDNENIFKGEAPKDIYPLYALYYSANVSPAMFDKDYLFVPCVFWSSYYKDDATVDLMNHRFSITYDPSQDDEVTTTMKLTLTDELVGNQSAERKLKTFRYQAFNISELIADFVSRHGDLTKIELSGMINDKAPNISAAEQSTVTINYSYK